MIVISQPTYLPWVGYFSLINEAKTFIFLDDVQFNSRSWQQRNRVLNNDMVKYLTIPVKKKGKKDQLIYNTSIDDKTIFQQHIKMINHFYSKSKFFNEYFNFFEKILSECEKYNYLSEVTGQLHALPHFHTQPINVVVYHGSIGRTSFEVSFPLRCFQQLSRPYLATRHCSWRYNRSTSGTSIPVLSY